LPEAEKLSNELDIPTEGLEEKKKVAPSVLFLIIICIIVILASLLIYWLNVGKASTLKTLDAKITDLNSQLSSKELTQTDLKLQTLAGQIAGLKKANANKTIWSKLFVELQTVTPKDVRYTNFSVVEEGTLTLAGETASYTTLAKFLVSLKSSDKFSDIKLLSAATQQSTAGKSSTTTLTFSVSLKVKTQALSEKAVTPQSENPAANSSMEVNQ